MSGTIDGVNATVNPTAIAPPAARYSHAMLSIGAERLLHTSGVVPTAPDGSVPAGLGQQVEVVWRNIAAILEEAGLERTDVVSVTTYVVVGEDLGVVMAGRDRALAGHQPASTLIVVPTLARPEWRLEIAVIATR